MMKIKNNELSFKIAINNKVTVFFPTIAHHVLGEHFKAIMFCFLNVRIGITSIRFPWNPPQF